MATAIKSNWRKNKKAAIFKNFEPSMTDQSQADSVDIVQIIKRFRVTGMAPRLGVQGHYADYSEIPNDLRGIIEQSRSIHSLRKKLPEALRDVPVEELLSMTPEQMARIVAPPPDKQTDKQEEKPAPKAVADPPKEENK